MDTAVNFSTTQFEQKGLLKFIKEEIHETGIDPSSLAIEITENVAISDIERCIHLMEEIKKIGMHISIDDFGTGFSSLSCLNRLPFDYLKIDSSFIQSIDTNKNNEVITRSVISMAHDLGYTVIAEGVEKEEQLKVLEKHGCDEAQGYYFCHPVSVKEIEKILKENSA